MKVLALNSSARVGNVSKTELFLNLLVKGMREAGGEVDVINLKDKKINFCQGCFSCWCKTPGECIFKDDMTKEIFPLFLDCDLLLMATPLFHFAVNAKMKSFIERTMPVMEPFVLHENGESSHPYRHKHPHVAVLSVAGFQEESVFWQLSEHVRKLYPDYLVAEIYRTASELFFGQSAKKNIQAVYDATVQAGAELVKTMGVSEKTLAAVKASIADNENFAPVANMTWQTCIDEKVNLGDFQKQKMVPRPDSIEMFLTLMRISLNREKAAALSMTVQFEFNGQKAGECYFDFNNGSCLFENGRIENPELVIKTPFDTWMDIVTGKAKGDELLMEKQYSVEGNVEHLIKMNELFGM